MKVSRRAPYKIVLLERGSSAGSLRALIAGPETGPGVWYFVSTAREAAQLVQDLNECYFHATRLRSARQLRRAAGAC